MVVIAKIRDKNKKNPGLKLLHIFVLLWLTISAIGMRTLEDFISASVYCRDRINPYLFIYALSVAILHRPDTQNLPIPSLTETFPEKFMDSAVFAQVKEETNIVEDSGQRVSQERAKYLRRSLRMFLSKSQGD